MQQKIQLKKLVFIDLVLPYSLRSQICRYVQFMQESQQVELLSARLQSIRVLKVGRSYYAYDQFALLNELKDFYKPPITFTVLKIDSYEAAIQTIVSSIALDSITHLDANHVSSLEKHATGSVGFRQNIKRNDWANILACCRSTFNHVDKKFGLNSSVSQEDLVPTIDLSRSLNNVGPSLIKNQKSDGR